MRGKAHKEEIWKDGYRITPAYAGKRVPSMALRLTTLDHPRVCGEKLGYEHQYIMQLGSPPRMRGKV